ncbi:hypothetical protein AU509_17225 [Lonsdalea britannica]|uniref:Glycine-rich domain-containing protein n=1 Tax=Lonsdalea britannica TaxID=1082704 RepID=A0AAD0WJ41_9GAMM|nr:hypothetical protein [Lonsdalea britannica]AXW85566.1 hypothetical protein CKQ53_00235 [Lonsdalea britannica]AXW88690.1 hypothetical protein CKQ53_18065 [Lonsdalea britannica]OSM93795.1 hypothetical protein AU509_17225 [Lonsdalea britannica]
MAELTEKAEWTDGIYQLETSDPVVGGPGGISNRQAQELAYRTRYLKDNLDATSAGLSQHESAADPHTQYAPKLNPTFSGTPKAPTPASDSNSDQLATTAFVKSIVAALVDGSPAALDTLKELSIALGNDANFASTVANSLAKKAPSNSPALSGIPTAPTAEPAVSTTQIATTAFVKSAIDANYAESVGKTLAGKMAIDQNGADIADKAQFRENLGFRENVQKEIARTRGLQKFLTSGQFVVPEGVSTVYLSGCGGGGGGGGGGCRTLTYEWGGGGGGGGAGQPIIKEAVNVTPGEVIAVTIGAAGSAGSTQVANDGTPGSTGGATTFGHYLTLAGGGGGDRGGGGSNNQFGGGGGGGYPNGSFGNDGVGGTSIIESGASIIASGAGGAGASGPFGGGGGMVRSSARGSAEGVRAFKGYGYGVGGGGGSTGIDGVGAEGQPGMLIVEW